jgi:hypothetical protein
MKVRTVGAITVLGAALVVSGCATNQQAGMYNGEGRSHGHMSQNVRDAQADDRR